MASNVFTSFDISSQGMAVQRMRLSAVANNIANANTTKGPDGHPYRREVVVVREIPDSPFERELEAQIKIATNHQSHGPNVNDFEYPPDTRVLQAKTVKDNSPPRLVYDPNHPEADEQGYVKMPNINIVTEMVEMITAQRAFDANTQVVDAAKNVARYSLEI